MNEDRWDCDFSTFVEELQMAPLIARDAGKRQRFIARFHREIAFVSLYLNLLAITGGANELAAQEPGECDLCAKPLAEGGFYVDGQIKDGSWANLCPNCYADNGTGIGWGIGQLYQQRPNETWQCIAGGDPNPPREQDD